MRIAASVARCLPKVVAAGAHVLPSAHGLRISIRCVTADPDAADTCARRCLGAVRRKHRQGSGPPGARAIHRPQALGFPRLRHLGWPRMRGVAPVRSHYARIAVEPAAHAG